MTRRPVFRPLTNPRQEAPSRSRLAPGASKRPWLAVGRVCRTVGRTPVALKRVNSDHRFRPEP
jgi:hypothetical protein